MKFEDIVKKVSSFVAAFIVFFIAAGMYLSWKGFVMQPDVCVIKFAETVPFFANRPMPPYLMTRRKKTLPSRSIPKLPSRCPKARSWARLKRR